ncbi:hypothetical protein RRG08_001582 [Elysia crispata]|uniref:Uncharacterized protein n=1 Tax=Elysia crispata TaxID=231223 RepID=A0AAE1AL87_9GAST|nr:hypothetical protein RRG08_001582 [Elysia crispata]
MARLDTFPFKINVRSDLSRTHLSPKRNPLKLISDRDGPKLARRSLTSIPVWPCGRHWSPGTVLNELLKAFGAFNRLPDTEDIA